MSDTGRPLLQVRKLKVILFALLTLCSALCWCCGSEKADQSTITIFAAAGSRPVTEALCDQFEEESGVKVLRNYASSGTLARQIANGAECDVFVSANSQWITFLKDKKMLIDQSVKKIAGNSLTIIAPKGTEMDMPVFDSSFDILSISTDKIAIGDPAYVPVGKYTKQVFDTLGWAKKIGHQTIMAKSVSAVLHYVELGECDWGVVYSTEAIQSDKVDIVAEVPADLHDPIHFFIADVTNQKQKGRELSKLFTDISGQKLFSQYGFKPTTTK